MKELSLKLSRAEVRTSIVQTMNVVNGLKQPIGSMLLSLRSALYIAPVIVNLITSPVSTRHHIDQYATFARTPNTKIESSAGLAAGSRMY